MEKEKLLSVLIAIILNLFFIITSYANEHEEWINKYIQNLEIDKSYIKDANKIHEQSLKKVKSEFFSKPKESIIKDGNKLQQFDKYIFVSASMPKQILINLSKEAKEKNAHLIFRGLIENNYLKTIGYLKNIIHYSKNSFVIDPELFKLYKVTQVPTFVVSAPLINNTKIEDGLAPKHDKLSGNVDLNFALTKMLEKGEIIYE